MKHFFSLLFTVFTSLSLLATVHTITNSSNTFTPNTISIVQGDTINWSIAAAHNVVEVDMATWSANGNTSNGGFTLPFGGGTQSFNTVGTFYYVCAPHAAGGMKGTITVTAPPPVAGDIDFAVDMRGYTGALDFVTQGVHINGVYNGWCGSCNAMSDLDGDSIYTATLNIPAGLQEFKYTIGGWSDQEMLTVGDPCVMTTGPNTNRVITVNGDATLDTICWNACTPCASTPPPPVAGDIDFAVDMRGYTGALDFVTQGVHINGVYNGWCGSCNAMSDLDGDSIYTATLNIPAGLQEFKYTIGGWSDQEMLTVGDPCVMTTGPNTNRVITVNGDATLDTICWNACTPCASTPPPPVAGDIDFAVDMRGYTGALDFVTQGVYINGAYNGWCGSCNAMSDLDGDSIYTATLNIPAGLQEFKYTIGGWSDQEILTVGDPCVMTTGPNTNRVITVNGDATLDTICWNACAPCASTTPPPVNNPQFCDSMVYHFLNPAEVASAIKLTITNTSSTTMDVIIESADMDTVDLLIITNGSGASISAESFPSPGVISRTLTWATAPTTVDLNILWSKNSFGGNWQLSTTDITVNFADTCSNSTPPPPMAGDIDFAVDMRGYTGALDFVTQGVHINGVYNGWCGSCNAMSDLDGDSIYTATLNIPAGLQEFKYTIGGWSDQEMLTVGAPCVMTTGPNTNRVITVNGDATLDTICWNACVTCTSTPPPPLTQMDLPVNFDDTATVNYGVIDFGGASSNFSTDPTGGTNKVVCTIKTSGSQPWAGTTLDAGTPKGFATAIPFSATVSKIAVDVYSPASGITMMLKVEDKSVPANTVFLETQTTTTFANTWETLVFDFTNTTNTGGGATLTGTTFDLVSLFYDFGTVGVQDTFYWDNVVLDTTPPCTPQPSTADAGLNQFNITGTSTTLAALAPTSGTGAWTISSGVGGTITDATLNNTSFTGVAGSSYILTWTITTACGTSTDDVNISFASNLAQMDLPVTFDDVTTINYSTLDFGGNASMFVIDPTGGTNMVVQSEKTNTADTWAGTTLATAGSPDLGFLNAVPFTTTATTMSVRVYSPDAGIPVRLKVEDETDNTVTVEAEVMTTVANTWETLVFDFANQASGTAALDLAKTYDKASIFFNFGTDGATAGSKTYYWDDVEFGGVVVDPCAGTIPDANILDDFECQGNIGYSFANATWTPNVANPDASGVNTSSMVGEFIHWGAGTDGAFGGALDLGPISLVTNNQLKMDIYTNATAIPITIVLQDAALNTIVESAMTTSATGAWETLTFDMSSASTATNVTNIVLVVNPGTNVQDTIYIDNVIMDGFVTDPCETAVPDKDIMEDFDCQRNLDYQFAEGGFITISNPDVSGINTSDNVGQYTRNNTVADAFGGDFTLAPLDFVSNNQIKMNVWDANAPSMVSMVLQDASGAGLGTVDVFTTTANVWEDLNFDFSAVPDAVDVSRIVLLFDAGVQADSGQVYFFDNLRMEGFVVSITELDETDINIYPNPANEILNLDLTNTLIENETKISIISMDGKIVEEFKVSANSKNISIDVSSISQGIYMLELSNSKYVWNTKVIID